MPGPGTSWAADVLDIQHTLRMIAYTADYAIDPADYVAWMTDDVEFVFPANPQAGTLAAVYRGTDAVLRGVEERRTAGVQGPGTHTRHAVSGEIVEILEADRARATAYWAYYTGTDATPELNSMGVYENEFRRTDAGWRLSRRVITIR